MDWTYGYMIGIVVCGGLWAYCAEEIKKKKALKRQGKVIEHQDEPMDFVYTDEISAPIMVTHIEPMEMRRRIRHHRQVLSRRYVVTFEFLDEQGEKRYGSYSTTYEQDISHINRVAYKKECPQVYRMLGSYRNVNIDAVCDIIEDDSVKGLVLASILKPLLESIVNKRSCEEAVLMLAELGTIIFMGLTAYSFYQALI